MRTRPAAWQIERAQQRQFARRWAKQRKACAHPEEHRTRKPRASQTLNVCHLCGEFWRE